MGRALNFMIDSQIFQIGIREYGIIIKLVESRVQSEINQLQFLYDHSKDRKITEIHFLELAQFTKYALGKNGIDAILLEMAEKRQWIEKWSADEYEKLARLDPEQTSLVQQEGMKELLAGIHTESLDSLKFLLLQEALMTPMYAQEDGKLREEQFRRENLEHLSHQLGLRFDFSKELLSQHQKNLDALTGNWKNTVKAAVIGISILLPFSFIVLPAALKAFSALTGLNSADITADGVANLGTGALAVKDGKLRQVHILIAGGLLFGRMQQEELFSYFSLLSKESILMICCKTLNFLQNLPKQDRLYAEAAAQFLNTKAEVEKMLLQKDIEPEKLKELLDKTDLLHKVFRRMKELDSLAGFYKT